MSVPISERVKLIKPSPTLTMNARAQALKAEGKSIISLGVGEPDFDTPEHIKQAAIDALHNGATRYTPVEGTPELKQAIQRKFKTDNNLSYSLDQILVSCGAKHSIYNIMQATLNPGDEVIIPAPYWVSYPDMALLAEAKPVVIQTALEQSLKMTAAQLAKAITPKTKMVILNSPSNPTGMAYSLEEWRQLGDVLKQHPHVLIVSDEIYETLYWASFAYSNILNACPELYDRTLIVNGVSKSYAMTGWRIGYCAGPKEIIGAMKKIQSQSTSNPCSISQAAATTALNGEKSTVMNMTRVFKERHDAVLAKIRAISGFECLAAHGTFYLFPNIRQAIARIGIESDLAFAEICLEQAGVAIVPGTAFGAPGYIRISFATSMDLLNTAIEKIHTLVK